MNAEITKQESSQPAYLDGWKSEAETLTELRKLKPTLHKTTLGRMRRRKEIMGTKFAGCWFYNQRALSATFNHCRRRLKGENMETNTTALVRMEPGTLQHANAYSAADVLQQVSLIQDVMRAAMKDGEHYGTIPGCGDKKTLKKPGAEKLGLTFRLAPEYDIETNDLPAGHREHRITCTLRHIRQKRGIQSAILSQMANRLTC